MTAAATVVPAQLRPGSCVALFGPRPNGCTCSFGPLEACFRVESITANVLHVVELDYRTGNGDDRHDVIELTLQELNGTPEQPYELHFLHEQAVLDWFETCIQRSMFPYECSCT